MSNPILILVNTYYQNTNTHPLSIIIQTQKPSLVRHICYLDPEVSAVGVGEAVYVVHILRRVDFGANF